jgi:hypothetical protein
MAWRENALSSERVAVCFATIVIAVPSGFSRMLLPAGIVPNLILCCKHFSQYRSLNSGHFGCAKNSDSAVWRDSAGCGCHRDDTACHCSYMRGADFPHVPAGRRIPT